MVMTDPIADMLTRIRMQIQFIMIKLKSPAARLKLLLQKS